jgi:cell division protein FtsL
MMPIIGQMRPVPAKARRCRGQTRKRDGTILARSRCSRSQEGFMRVFLGMILGALLLVAGVYIYDSMQTSTVANGQVAEGNRTIVNWDVAATDWHALKTRAHDDWVRLSSK